MRYSASKKSVFGAFFAGLIVVCAFETPIVHLVLMGRVRAWVQLLVAALNVYMIVWLWLERRRTRDAGFIVTDDGLVVDIGTRWRGTIDWRELVAVRFVPARAIGAERPRGVLWVTPIDAPNVELIARTPIRLRGKLGIVRQAPRAQLYVDEPEAFVAAIKQRIRAISPPAP